MKTNIIQRSKIALGKSTSRELMATRNKILSMFGAVGLHPESAVIISALADNQLKSGNVPIEKVGDNYNAEWARLHQMVKDLFVGLGRKDLAQSFATSVPIYTAGNHPIDFIATLLKGAGSPEAVKAQEGKYAVLVPFAEVMQNSLVSKGIAAPGNIEDLSQLFYNNFVAQKSNYNLENWEQIDFLSLPPGHNLDDPAVDAIITYVKGLQEQKNEGKQLPKVLDQIATTANSVQDSLTKQAKVEISKEVGSTVIKNSQIILIVAMALAGLIFWLLMRK